MRLRTVREPYEPGRKFVLYPLGDFHLGSANCDKGLLDKVVAAIKFNPDARWIGMGDYGEFISVKDPRWSAGGIDDSLFSIEDLGTMRKRYIEILRERLLPIADKCWSLGEGNHEQKYDYHHDEQIVDDLRKQLGLKKSAYTGWSAITRVVFEDANNHRSSLKVYHAHGWQAGRLDGAKVNQLDHVMGWIEDCHIYLFGHSHSRLVTTKTKLGTNPSFSKLKAYDAYGAHCGSFLRTYQQNRTSYSERAGYPPTSLGPIRFIIKPGTEGVSVEAVQ